MLKLVLIIFTMATQSITETALANGGVPEKTKGKTHGDCKQIQDYRCYGNSAHCSEIVPFNPTQGVGYWNYPLNGETESNQYRSFARRDLVMLIKYAAAHTSCMSRNWQLGNGHPLGLGDMSEKDGGIPGTSVGQPGHPQGTHVNGSDMDIAYYQLRGPNNFLRPVCEHTILNQQSQRLQDAYRCTDHPDNLDIKRTALFFAKLHDSQQLRVIGVDGKIGDQIHEALNDLCDESLIKGEVCRPEMRKIAYEKTNRGHGWYHFHHHHFHVSIMRHNPNQQLPISFDELLGDAPLSSNSEWTGHGAMPTIWH